MNRIVRRSLIETNGNELVEMIRNSVLAVVIGSVVKGRLYQVAVGDCRLRGPQGGMEVRKSNRRAVINDDETFAGCAGRRGDLELKYCRTGSGRSRRQIRVHRGWGTNLQ